jgi:hypothetical protein
VTGIDDATAERGDEGVGLWESLAARFSTEGPTKKDMMMVNSKQSLRPEWGGVDVDYDT